jgi:hypothetical protein
MLLNSPVKRSHSDRSEAVRAAREAAMLEAKRLDDKALFDSHAESLKQVCSRVLTIAQKYIPATILAYSDADELVKCAKLLKSMGVDVDVAAKFAAKCDAADADAIVVNSNTYRRLKHKAIAGFATLADMTEKPSATGNEEYQNGVREGYRRASVIAITFLEDIQQGD